MNSKQLEEFRAHAEAVRRSLDAIATAVGHLVVNYNRLERGVGECLARLLDGKRAGLVDSVNAALGMRQRIDLLAALYRDRVTAANELALLDYCVKMLRFFEEERNRVVHSNWVTSEFGSSEFSRMKESVSGAKGLRVTAQPADVSTIMKVSQQINDFAFLDFVELYRVCTGQRSNWRSPMLSE